MKETSSSRACSGCRLVFDALPLSGFPLLCYLIVPNQNNCNNCLSEEIKLEALKSSVETAFHGRIRAFRKVIPPLSFARAGPCGAGWELRVGRGAGCCLGGVLLQRAVGLLVAERSAILCQRGCGGDMRLKTVLCEGDILHPCKPPALPGALRARSSRACPCACFPRRENPPCPGG